MLDPLVRIVGPERVLTRPIELVAFASDASFYRLIPKAVVLPRSIEEIQALFRFSHQQRLPLVFRAAGTSLSGQAITDGILVDVARYWRGATVEAGGKKLRVQPGVIGSRANLLLKPYGAKIGPDPASIDACMIGGILANNSSGMCCGVSQNAYHTLESLKFVLPSGTVIDTADAISADLFWKYESRLAEGLLQLRNEIHENTALSERIRRKYRMKNTTGYSLNAFIDFEHPLEIFRQLLIGSEGTLAFIAEAVLNTVPHLPVKYTGLLLFSDLYEACAAIVPLRDAGAEALELMDAFSLRSVANHEGAPPLLKGLPDTAAGLLVEFQAAEESERPALEHRARHVITKLTLLQSPAFTHKSAEQALLWKIRKGMFPSVGATRRSGTSVIIEDVVFPVENLAPATVELRQLLTRHGYESAIIFGHAKDGNLHFVIAQSFNDQATTEQYARLMDDVVRLVLGRYDGALKGEHGTGRNMAPFVEAEWGHQAYEIMRKIKVLADPENLLNPGVILNSSPKAHVENVKTLPTVEEEVDKCIECGYCESRCPSRDLTLTPRQRIVVRREMERLRSDVKADGNMAGALDADFPYMALDTCAVDGLCAVACPVGIDTGSLTKRLRQARHSPAAHKCASLIASNLGLAERGMRFALRAGHFAQKSLGKTFVNRVTIWAHRLSGRSLPIWTGDVPRAASGRFPQGFRAGAHAVYFPSCISRTMGCLPGEATRLSSTEAALEVARRAGMSIFVPEDVAGTCCGVPFSSKGYAGAHEVAVNLAVARFWKWSEEGRLPIIVDTSACAYGLLTCRDHLNADNKSKYDRLRILDSVPFMYEEVLPRLTFESQARSVVLHPVCSLVKMNLVEKFEKVAQACSREVFIPPNSGCCGFAGDRGFMFPELTESATRHEAAEAKAVKGDGYYSTARTCEVAMTRSTGQIYRSYLHLLEETTRGQPRSGLIKHDVAS